jgi:hypothetical protein
MEQQRPLLSATDIIRNAQRKITAVRPPPKKFFN